MSQTIETFQNFYKPTKEESFFSIKSAVEEASFIVSATYQFYDITLKIDYKNDPKAFGNANEYAQVILNLLNNAKDIFIKKSIQNPRVQITVATLDEKSCVSISDNGGGFDQDVLNKAFSPHTSGTNSTGMGLYMSQTIMEKNSGKLKIENSEGGAKISVVL